MAWGNFKETEEGRRQKEIYKFLSLGCAGDADIY